MVLVRAPLAGRVDALDTVPDAVFAAGMLGAGVAIDPLVGDGVLERPEDALAPVAGILAAVQPHAFAVQPEEGPAILVHLGLDTVSLVGAGFEALADRGALLDAGDGVIAWDPAAVAGAGLSPLVPVIAIQSSDIRYLVEPGAVVEPGQPLFEAD